VKYLPDSRPPRYSLRTILIPFFQFAERLGGGFADFRVRVFQRTQQSRPRLLAADFANRLHHRAPDLDVTVAQQANQYVDRERIVDLGEPPRGQAGESPEHSSRPPQT